MSGSPMLRRVPALAWDVALCGVFCVLGQVEVHLHGTDGFQAGSPLLNGPLELLVTLPLALRRVAPVPVLAAMLAAVALPSLVVEHSVFFWGGLIPLAIANYSVARAVGGWAGRWMWLIAIACVNAAVDLHALPSGGLSELVFTVVVLGASWLAGRVMRRLTVQASQLSDALARLADEQAARAHDAVLSERGRIAVEMHDVVAHAVSLMVVQIGAARLAPADSDETRSRALLLAESTGRKALTELRQTLGGLRDEAQRSRQPLPGLADLPDLVEQFHQAGLRVESQLDPAVSRLGLPGGIQLAAYRVVQESLTNVLKHAGPVATEVRIDLKDGRLRIEVSNRAGTPATTLASGQQGLVGMRERARMFGGCLTAGPTPEGYLVYAELPVQLAAEVS